MWQSTRRVPSASLSKRGISSDRVDVLLNFVDLGRFTPRPPLPARPRRALVFSNQAREVGYVTAIREACRESAVDLVVAGQSCSHVIERPEEELKEFDLVFAKARAALEAMAVGCGVIVADLQGAGPLVTTRDFAYLRSRNFGMRLLQQPHRRRLVSNANCRLRRDDAAAVSALVETARVSMPQWIA